MRVPYITTIFPRWEGDPHSPWIVQAILLLRERGVEIEVLAPSYQGLGDHLIYGIPVHRYRYFFPPWESLTHTEGAPNKIKNPLYLALVLPYMLFGALATVKLCRGGDFEVIHVHWPLPQGIFGWIGKRLSGARLVASFHGAELLLTRRYPFLRPVLRRIVETCDAVSANSSFTAGLVREIAPSAQVRVIPYGPPLPFQRGEEIFSPPANDRRKRILFVGRLIERKGLPYLIEALSLLPDRDKIRLDIVGSGSQETELKKLVREKGLEEAVIFHGRVSEEELNRLYAFCDLFVLPSIVDSQGDTEGLGVVLLEALSYKKPIIGTNVGGIPDIIRHEETGLLVEPKNPVALAEAMEKVLSNPALAKELAERGYAYLKERFSWSRLVDEILALYVEAGPPPCPSPYQGEGEGGGPYQGEGRGGGLPQPDEGQGRVLSRKSEERAGRWRRLLGAIVLLLALTFMGHMVYLNWEEVRGYQWQFDYPWLILSILSSLGTTAFFIWQWDFTLQRLGAELPYRKAFRIWFIANLGRYVPGKVWQFAGWFYLCGQEGINKTQTLASILINQALQNVTGLILAWAIFLFSPQTGLNAKFWPLLGFIPLGAIVIHPRVMEWGLNFALALLGRGPVNIPLRALDLTRFALHFFIFWLAFGMAFYFFVRSLYPVPLNLWPALAGVYAGAYVIGFLSLLTPGGLGVREGALAYLLSFYLPAHIALIAALLSRLWGVAVEILGIALALGLKNSTD